MAEFLLQTYSCESHRAHYQEHSMGYARNRMIRPHKEPLYGYTRFFSEEIQPRPLQ